MDRLRGGNRIRSLNTVHSVHSMFLLLLYRISGQDAQQGQLLARGLPSTSRLTRHAEPERRLLGGSTFRVHLVRRWAAHVQQCYFDPGRSLAATRQPWTLSHQQLRMGTSASFEGRTLVDQKSFFGGYRQTDGHLEKIKITIRKDEHR